MTFGRLTTKWRIFRNDLPHENGTQKNCQIIRVAMKLHNYVINANQLIFLNTDINDLDAFEVERLPDGPDGNLGYLPTVSEELYQVGIDPEHKDQRNQIVHELHEKGLSRPERNINRNT